MNVAVTLPNQLRKASASGLTLVAPLLFACSAQAQQADDVWTRFEDPKTELYGYKDGRGVVRVKPRFSGLLGLALRFRYITAVTEGPHQAYLLKTGRLVARDSAYVFDYTFDCESEGYIRFQTHDRTGFLNQQGKPVIPAIYNAASPFHNGVAVVLKGARRRCWGEMDTLHCEHPGWTGGTAMLINTRNEVLVPDLGKTDVSTLNWYSLKVNPAATDTLHRVQLLGAGGTVYSLVDYEREFRGWFYHDFLPAVRSGNAQQLTARCFTRLAISQRRAENRQTLRRTELGPVQAKLLRQHLSALRPELPQVSVMANDLNSLEYDDPDYAAFFTLCDTPDTARFPIFLVAVNYAGQTPQDLRQEQFYFIRTAEGYQLFEVVL